MSATEELHEFVRESLARGLPRDQVEGALIGAGWQREQVRAALARFADDPFPVPVPRPAPYLSARDAFLYLLLFTTLYMAAYNLGRLLVELINLNVPDPTTRYGNAMGSRQAIRWAVSSLIVAFPVFLYLASYTGKEVAREPAKRASRIRRWLTYLTLFVSAVVVIGDVIVVLNDLLGGELTLRFTLKALVIGGIAGSAFAYYLRDLRRDEQEVT
jgi:hypothetical protein